MSQFPSSNKKEMFNLQSSTYPTLCQIHSYQCESLFIGAAPSPCARGYAVAVPPSGHEGNLCLLIQELSLLLWRLFITVGRDRTHHIVNSLLLCLCLSHFPSFSPSYGGLQDQEAKLFLQIPLIVSKFIYFNICYLHYFLYFLGLDLPFLLACGLWLVPVNAALCVAGLSLLMNPK